LTAIEIQYLDSPIGLILPKLTEIKDKGCEMNLAIDFGTSNTIAAYQEGENIKIISFKDETMESVKLLKAEIGKREGIITENFFSKQPDIKNNFIYTQINHLGTNGVLIQDGVVYFPNPTISEVSRIAGDLKWLAEEPKRIDEAKNKIKIFLEHLLLIISAVARKKGVTRIHLSWTYPSAYSEAMKTQILKRDWDEIIEDIKGNTGVEIIPKEPLTESVAICRFMVHKRDLAAVGSNTPQIVMDIGGGTTDIGIWFENSLKLQTSFRLAGNVIAERIENDEEFRKNFLKNVKREGKELMHLDSKVKDNPSLYLNLILSDERNQIDFFRKFDLGRSIIFFGLSSIFYYSGLLLRTFSQNVFQNADIYLAGNGSKLFDLVWTFNWRSKEQNKLTEALCDIFEKGYGKSIKAEINFPIENVKEEVAKGALAPANIKFDKIENPVLLVGESGYTINGKELSWNDDLLEKVKPLEEIDGKFDFEFKINNLELEKFIESYNSHYGNDRLSLMKVEVNTQDFNEIANKVLATIRMELNKEKKDDRFLQPLFISEIKEICKNSKFFPQ
jgi:hypothetical protein